MLSVVARGPAPPEVRVLRGEVEVARARGAEEPGADPLSHDRTWTALVPAAPGDRVVVPGLEVEVQPGDGVLYLLDHPAGWRRVDLLVEAPVGPVDGASLGQQAVLGAGALLLVLLVLAVLAPARRSQPVPVLPWRWSVLLLGVPAAILGTWPMALAGWWTEGGALVQRNFDGFGSAWLLWLLAQGGEALPHRLDTVAYAAVGRILALVLAPVTAYHAATALGMATSFAAASWVAGRQLGGGVVGGLAAGLAYAWSPLAGTALAEGHGGWLLGAGLPLLLGALLAEEQGRPWREAALVVGAGLLCAAQSGYAAVMAALAVGLLGLAANPRRVLRVAVLALPAAVAYALVVLPDATAREGGARSWEGWLRLVHALPPSDVATLDTLLGEPPAAGLLLRHVRHGLGYALLAGGLLIPLLRRDRVGLLLGAFGLAGVVLALGPSLLTSVAPDGSRLAASLPYLWLVELLPPLALFRFPVRFLWLWYAAAGLATARSVAWLVRCRSRAAWVLVAAVAIEGLLAVRPWEPRTTLAGVPSAYAALQPGEVVLDLWPLHAPDHPDALLLKELGCWYRTGHAAEVPVPCLDVEVDRARLYPLQRRLAQALVEGEEPRAELDAAGVTAVAWHPDAFSPELRPAVEGTLRSWWGEPVARSVDHGEAVVLWRRAP